jgi:hypothetical protein
MTTFHPKRNDRIEGLVILSAHYRIKYQANIEQTICPMPEKGLDKYNFCVMLYVNQYVQV